MATELLSTPKSFYKTPPITFGVVPLGLAYLPRYSRQKEVVTHLQCAQPANYQDGTSMPGSTAACGPSKGTSLVPFMEQVQTHPLARCEETALVSTSQVVEQDQRSGSTEAKSLD